MKIIIFIFCFIPSLVLANPLDRFLPDNVAGSVRFKDKLVGTTWSYSWRGNEYVFGFESDGSISKLKSWSTVTWVITAPNEVVLEGISDRMVLLFDSTGTTFKTIDWDGQKSNGRLVK